ncbi:MULTISPECIES: porin family protein [Cellulophaga]|uniref:PorT protein n=1 Tax=Cellulophaga lytica (strain ATCC 23178 / DSM 7489 / JCM 8516 / NBRC 14961 / NCIMB 1423 / VKM B-1433 / Cy l20) TaxID=867900 RepID=F0RB80_CELLC|nr:MULTISPECIES: porin family protein [Cellulophaga]ADY28482.1 PorT protein [Cellulophaga lytica DSM 7489]AIM59536.1 PorT protein [Cellulophaga lytica]APU09348.1 PorT protein [Cellulophaga lytica]MDO6855067.1 porin family protein [Cellulophaga lytica]TVZ08953.1 outer membrane protein with beta-barrel domain [Cellulophaga sp. RHA_52]
MKKILFLFLCLFIAGNTANAQFNEDPIINLESEDLRPLNWGYFLGFNQYDFKFDYKDDLGDVLVDKSLGFNVGLIGELRLNEFLDLRFEPGLHYTKRTLGFRGFTDANDAIREIKSTYINFPLLLKVSTRRIGNWKPYIIGGASTSMNLSANEDSVEDNSSATFRMKKNTYYYEMGFGIDFYLEYFKFSPSIRGVFAINNELVPDADPNSPWTGNINSMKTRGIFINFTFE